MGRGVRAVLAGGSAGDRARGAGRAEGPEPIRVHRGVAGGGDGHRKKTAEHGLSLLGVDSGFYTDEVYDFCRPRQAGRWWQHQGRRVGAEVYASKGEFFAPGSKGAAAATPAKWTWPEDKEPHIGAANPHRDRGIMLLHVNTGFFKRLHFDTLRSELNAAEALRACQVKVQDGKAVAPEEWPAADARRWFFPVDTGKDYFDQITSEQELPKPGRDGRITTVWSKIPGQPDNHFLDCRVGNLCLVRAANVAERLRRAGKR